MSDKVNILLVDDHSIFRSGLSQLLADSERFRVTRQAGDITQALKVLSDSSELALMILDINLAGQNALDHIPEIREIRPDIPVLIMSMYPAEQFAPAAYQAGANGYITKDASEGQLYSALEILSQGQQYIHPDLEKHNVIEEGYPHDKLSEKELRILKFIANGESLTEIGETMFLSVKTVSTYRSRILEKLSLNNNAELIKYALMHGLSV